MTIASMRNVLQEAQSQVALANGFNTGRHYHGLLHTQMVMEYVIKLSFKAGLSTSSRFALVYAAAGHDLEQGLGSVANEMESAKQMGDIMRRNGIPEAEIERVQELIQGTVVTWTDGIMHQRAENMDHMAKLLADADLCSLGASHDEFVKMTLRLMAELAKKASLSELTPDEVLAGWKNQVKFMTGRRFLTTEANEMMGWRFQENLAYAKKMAG